MEIKFEIEKHERLVNDYQALCKRFNKIKGINTADKILLTLNALSAADSLADVPPGFRPHPLTAQHKGCFAVDVDKKFRIVFKPDPSDVLFRIDNFKSIKKIIILEIYTDYH